MTLTALPLTLTRPIPGGIAQAQFTPTQDDTYELTFTGCDYESHRKLPDMATLLGTVKTLLELGYHLETK